MKHITKETSFEDYCLVMFNHSPAFVYLHEEVKLALYKSYVFNSKIQKPELTLSLLTSVN